MNFDTISILLIGIALVLGTIVGILLKERSFIKAEKNTKKLIEDAELKAEELKKESLKEAKEEIRVMKLEANNEINERKERITDSENKLIQREEILDKRFLSLEKREETLNQKEDKLESIKIELEDERSKVEELIIEQEDKLLAISALTKEEAKEEVLDRVRRQMNKEVAEYIVEQEEIARETATKKAKEYIVNAVEKYSSEVTSETTVSVVTLPTDEMKGRIIGREGRNIRAIEALTGVDLIIDDTPDAVVLSCFDPIRREVARMALNSLVNDGRIHPAKIEEAVDKAQKEIEEIIMEKGREAVYKTGIGKINRDLVRLIGKLWYRTSYGQNVLNHSIEVAMFAGALAAEIGEDEILARRAGLLHDIGKSIDYEMEGSHVEIGIRLAEKYGENSTVINGIASHHGDEPATSFISSLVSAADTLSAARPGARSEQVQNYFERLQKLEEISKEINGVSEAYAISAGREIRIMVHPDQIDDLGIYTVAREVKNKIEEKLSYPGTVKVTVIREQRAIDVAK